MTTAGPAAPWIHRLNVALQAIPGPLLLWVQDGHLAQLGTLVRGLRTGAGKLSVERDVKAIDRLPEGSTFILIPKPGDAAWLNLRRPVLTNRSLRIILWTDPAITPEMTREAVDFVDWATRAVECPPGPPRFAIAGVRAAICSRMPLIPYTGAFLDPIFAQLLPRRSLVRLPLPEKYEKIVEELKNNQKPWLAIPGLPSQFHLRRLLWAMAEAGRRGRVFLENPAEGVFPWSIREDVVDLDEALGSLASRGVSQPGRWVALLDSEPAAIQAALAAIDGGMELPRLEAILETTSDPGAELGKLGFGVPLHLRHFSRFDGGANEVILKWSHMDAFQRAEAAIYQKDNEVGTLWFSSLPPTFSKPDQARWLSLTAHMSIEQGIYQKAEQKIRTAINAEKENPFFLHQLSNILQRQGKYAEAEEVARESLAISAKILGKEHPSYAASLHQLAIILENQGKYTEAEEMVRGSIAIKEKTVGKEHPEYAASLHQLAIILENLGKYTEAEEVVRESLAINAKTVGKEHPSYAASLHQLAIILQQQGKYAEAEEVVRESLAISAKTVGKQHPSYAASLRQLAITLENQGKYGEAEGLIQRSLTIKEKIVGKNHPDYAASLYELASILFYKHRFSLSIKFLRQAIAIYSSHLGPSHPNTLQCQKSLDTVLARQAASLPPKSSPPADRQGKRRRRRRKGLQGHK